MEDLASEDYWRKCSSCKRPITYGGVYWVCSVSTCNRKRTALLFCSVACWDAHIGVLRHRDSWAEERKAPTRDEWKAALATGGDWPPKPLREKEKKDSDLAAPKSASPKIIRRPSGS